MWIEVSKVDHEKLMQEKISSEQTQKARTIVNAARAAQKIRFQTLGLDISSNSSIPSRDLARAVFLSSGAQETLNNAAKTYDISGRGYHRIVKLARTIADIDSSKTIEAPHILEALQYRQKHFKN